MGWGKALRWALWTEVLGACFLHQRQSFPLKSWPLKGSKHAGCGTSEQGMGATLPRLGLGVDVLGQHWNGWWSLWGAIKAWGCRGSAWGGGSSWWGNQVPGFFWEVLSVCSAAGAAAAWESLAQQSSRMPVWAFAPAPARGCHLPLCFLPIKWLWTRSMGLRCWR